MPALLEFREKIRTFYAKYAVYIRTIAKFLVALLILLVINQQIGSMDILLSPFVVVAVALLCSFMPVNATVFLAAVFSLGHLYQSSLAMMLIAGLFYLIMMLLYFRFTPKDAYIVLLLPVLFLIKIPYVMPLLAGLLAGPASAVSVACGTVIYYIMELARNNGTLLSGVEEKDITARLQILLDALVNNKEMLLIMIAFAATVVIVYLIRRLSIDYAWYIAIGVGALSELVIVLAGDFMMDVSGAILSLVLGILGSAVIGIVVQFFFFAVDYSGTEYVQYEDDEYYYYVKAVPKMTVSKAKKTVQTINEKRPEKRTRTYMDRTIEDRILREDSRSRK